MILDLVDQQCKLFISMQTGATGYETASWADIWAAGVAMREMCVKRRELGSAVEIGRSKRIYSRIMIWPFSLLVPPLYPYSTCEAELLP